MTDHHQLPTTLEDAKARGYERIADLKQFLREKLGISDEAFGRHRDDYSLTAGGVDCGTAPQGTPCFRQCYEDKHIAVFGACGPNRTCDLYQGRC